MSKYVVGVDGNIFRGERERERARETNGFFLELVP
jgi:hypothetical protein